MKIIFDTEGITNCPMNETATRAECFECPCRKPINNDEDTCIYDLVYPEPEEEVVYAGQVL